MNAATYTLAGVIITVLGGIVVALLRNSKTSPESRTADAQVWSMLNGNLATEVTRLTGEVARLTAGDTEKTRQIATLQSDVHRLSGAEEMLHRAYHYITDLITWGRNGGGGEPPAPPAGFVLPADPS